MNILCMYIHVCTISSYVTYRQPCLRQEHIGPWYSELPVQVLLGGYLHTF